MIIDTNVRPRRIGWKIPGDYQVYWLPMGLDTERARTLEAKVKQMAVRRYQRCYGELPDQEILGQLVLVTDLEAFH